MAVHALLAVMVAAWHLMRNDDEEKTIMGKVLEFRRPTPETTPATALAARVDYLETASPAERAQHTEHQFCRAIDEILAGQLATVMEWRGGAPRGERKTAFRQWVRRLAESVLLDSRMHPGFSGLDLMGGDTSTLRTRYAKIRREQRNLAKRANIPYKTQTKLEQADHDAELLDEAERHVIQAARIALDALQAGGLGMHFASSYRLVTLLVARAQQL